MSHIILDLESTSWESSNLAEDKEIIEIAAILLDEKLEAVGEFDRIVRPLERPLLSSFCSEQTRIRQDQVDGADSFPIAFQQFLDWTGPGTFTLACWGDFDVQQLQRDCKRHGVKFPKRLTKKFVDIKTAFASRHRIRPCSLLQALQMLRISAEGKQPRGITDARNTARIYRSVFKHGG